MSTTRTKSSSSARKRVPANAVHPGEILREEFMAPLSLTSYRLAKDLNVPLPRVNDLIREKRALTADMALRLARYFDMTPQTWMNLQSNFELDLATARKNRDPENQTSKLSGQRSVTSFTPVSGTRLGSS